ncbi:MAG: thymidine kinase [Bacteroidetes bacterium]|nr:thymidine kinase [Bacteroidota bacterium]
MGDFTLIYGCMFSGKTTKMIELYHQSGVEFHEKIAIKPLLDNRYSPDKINAHSGLQMPGHRITRAEELFPLAGEGIKEVYIDEVQFFQKNIADTIIGLTMQGIHVFAAGLDTDYLGNPFGEFPRLYRMANTRIRLEARCQVCGKPARYTYRTTASDAIIAVGHADMYEARCGAHWAEGTGLPEPVLQA